MSMQGQTPQGWYHAEGDPPGTKRHWDGEQWVGEPQVMMDGTTDSLAAGGLASPGKRMGGRVIDTIIIVLVYVPLLLAILLPSIDWDLIIDAMDAGDEIPPDALPGTGTLAAFSFLTTAIGFAWDTLWIGLKGGTPGKLMLGMRVVDADTGAMPSMATAARRSANRLLGLLGAVPAVGSLISLIGGLIGLASTVMLFVDERNQTVMDKFGKTIVVEKSAVK